MRHPLIFIPKRATEIDVYMRPIGLAGYVSWRLLRKGKIVRESPRQSNMLVDSGLDALGADHSFASGMYAQCGTGSTVPTSTDTALQSAEGTKVFQGTVTDGFQAIVVAGDQDYAWRKIIFTFGESNANGNLTEFGTFQGSSGAMFSRQLFKDVGGTPTTIIKTDEDQLEVTYEYRAFPTLDDVTSSINVSGDNQDIDVTIRAYNVDSSSLFMLKEAPVPDNITGKALAYEDNTLMARDASKTGSGTNSSTPTYAAYIDGTFYIDETLKWEPSVANFATGIGYFLLYVMKGTNPLYQASLSAQILKTNVKRLTLNVRRSWGRYVAP